MVVPFLADEIPVVNDDYAIHVVEEEDDDFLYEYNDTDQEGANEALFLRRPIHNIYLIRPHRRHHGLCIASTVFKLISFVSAVVCITTATWTFENQLNEDTLETMVLVTDASGGISLLLDVLVVPLMAWSVSTFTGAVSKDTGRNTHSSVAGRHSWLRILSWILYATTLLFGIAVVYLSDSTIIVFLIALYVVGSILPWTVMFLYAELLDSA